MEKDLEKVIIVDHLTQDYGHGRGIFDISLCVQKGEVYGFLGPNGAGKSTTIRHLMGFSKPQSGNCFIFGQEAFKNYYKILANVGYLPGEIALPEGLTGFEFIEMMQKLRNCKDKTMLKYLLDKFKLNPAGETKKMSLGDKRKLAIVTAFMADPDVLILDEPTSGLDPVMQQNFIDFIKEEKKRGKTILLSSHMFNEVEATCDRISIIKDGKIVSTFETNYIKHSQDKKFLLKMKNKENFEKILNILPKYRKNSKQPSIIKSSNENLSLIVAVNDKYINNLINIIKDFEFENFEELKYTVEDHFIQFYREDKNFGGVL